MNPKKLFGFTLFIKPPYQPFPKQALVFTCLQYKSFENTVGKGEIAQPASFSHSVFCPFGDLPIHQIWNYGL